MRLAIDAPFRSRLRRNVGAGRLPVRRTIDVTETERRRVAHFGVNQRASERWKSSVEFAGRVAHVVAELLHRLVQSVDAGLRQRIARPIHPCKLLGQTVQAVARRKRDQHLEVVRQGLVEHRSHRAPFVVRPGFLRLFLLPDLMLVDIQAKAMREPDLLSAAAVP